MSFACELYLKSLLSVNEDPIHGHNLYELYKELSLDKKCKIINAPCFKGDTNFEKELEENKDVFQDWRYSFEHKPIQVDVIFLENFAYTLYDLLLNDTVIKTAIDRGQLSPL